MLRSERRSVGGGRKGSGFVSDAADEAAEVVVELSPSARAICGFCTGVSRQRAAGGPFLRGIEVVDLIIFMDCGLERGFEGD